MEGKYFIAHDIYPQAFGPIRSYFRSKDKKWESIAGIKSLELASLVLRNDLTTCEAKNIMEDWLGDFRRGK